MRQDFAPLKSENVPQKDTRIESQRLQMNPQDIIDPVKGVSEGITEIISKEQNEVKAGSVEGDRASESKLDFLLQEHGAFGDIHVPSTVIEEPTTQHIVPIPGPSTPIPSHSVTETPSLPPTPPQTPPSVVDNQHPTSFSPPKDFEYEPVQVKETAAHETAPAMTSGELFTEKTASQDIIALVVLPGSSVMGESKLEDVDPENMLTDEEVIPEDMVTEEDTVIEISPGDMISTEATPEDMSIKEVVRQEMVTAETAPDDMIIEEAAQQEMMTAETSPEDMIIGEATQQEMATVETAPEDMIVEVATQQDMVTVETTPDAPSEQAMGTEQDASNTAHDAEMQVDQGNASMPTLQSPPAVQPPLASWYSKPWQYKGAKRFAVVDHYGEGCCRDKRRVGDQNHQQVIYPRDISFDRFQAVVRLSPPIRLQLMLQSYVGARIQELGPARMERHYLERLYRKSEQDDRDYGFDACWRKYAASRPHGQREPPFTLDEAITLVSSCLAATLPNDDWLVRRAEHDFREELMKEVKYRHRELEEVSWSSSWVCPRRNPPHLAEDPKGHIQRFSRDYARLFFYYIIDKENLRCSYYREGGGNDAKCWIDGVRTRSDFISIRDPQTPWCLRRGNNFQLLATWAHNDMKDCRGFISFTNMWFGECIASGIPPEAAKMKFRRFDKDRCDWLKHYAGIFPQDKA